MLWFLNFEFYLFVLFWEDFSFSCHMTESGRVYASGLNDFGQLGISDDKNYAMVRYRVQCVSVNFWCYFMRTLLIVQQINQNEATTFFYKSIQYHPQCKWCLNLANLEQG